MNGYSFYEINANSDYILHTPMSSNFVFCINLTQKLKNLSVLKCVCDTIRYITENDIIENVRSYFGAVGFTEKNVLFFKFNQNGVSVLEIGGDEVFLPYVQKDLLVPFDDNKENILRLCDIIEHLYDDDEENKKASVVNENKSELAIRCSKELLRNKGGKIIMINSGKPGKDKAFYEKMGKELLELSVSIDIFQIQYQKEPQGLDVIGEVCSLTNGNLYYFKNFNISMQYNSLFQQIIKVFPKQRAYDVKMQVCTPEYIEIELLTPITAHVPMIDKDDCFSILLRFRQKEKGDNNNNQTIDNVPIQFNLVYTDLNGATYIRVISRVIPTVRSSSDYLQSINLESATATIVKTMIKEIYRTNNIANSIAKINQLYIMQSLHNIKSFKYKEFLDQLIMCFLGVMKSKAFCVNPGKFKIDPDLVSYIHYKLFKCNHMELLSILIPKVYNIGKLIKGEETLENLLLSPTGLSSSYIEDSSIYIIDNYFYTIVYFTNGASANDNIKKFFGEEMNFNSVGTFFQKEEDIFSSDTFEVEKCQEMVDYIRRSRDIYGEVFFSFEGSMSEKMVKEIFILDSNCPWFAFSYSEYYKQI